MGDKLNAQTFDKRQIVAGLDRQFARLYSRSCAIIQNTPDSVLYAAAPATVNGSVYSVGEAVLRCAATIEQTFGGITSNLWDDPFEWTLPEHLSTPAKISAHLDDVEATRARAFESFTEDACLLKEIATPSGEMRALIELLLETLVRAAEYQGQAIVAFQSLSGIKPPGFII